MEANTVPLNQTGSNGAAHLIADTRSSPRYAPTLTRDARRRLAVSGLWSGLGFVGAGTLAAGLLMLVSGGTGAAIALALVIAGGVVATFGWRGAWKVLANLEPEPAGEAAAGAARGGADTAIAQHLAATHPRTALAGH